MVLCVPGCSLNTAVCAALRRCSGCICHSCIYTSMAAAEAGTSANEVKLVRAPSLYTFHTLAHHASTCGVLFLLLVVGLLRTHALGRTSPHAVLLPCVCALCFDALTVAWRCGRVYGLGGLLQDDEFAGFRSSMLLFVNGKKIELADVQPEVTLLAFLRSLGLSGTKLGCGEGGCGACTVMVSSFEHGRVVHRSVNACLAPLCSVDSCAVTTVEGIGGTRRGAGGLHPVQERIAKMHGSQCGFCTPGIVMALYTFLRNNPRPTASQIEDSMDGNLCRCTGVCQALWPVGSGRALPPGAGC